MRPDSPFVLAIAGTFALHLLLIMGADALIVLNPPELRRPTPSVELVDIELPKELPPPPPPVQPPEPEPEPEAKPPPPPDAPRPEPRVAKAATPPPPSAEPPPPPTDTPPDPGGAPTVAMPDIGPAATGVPVAPGPKNPGPIGRGGSGGGTGAGSGAGAGPELVPMPISIATIKTLALPKGDYGYLDIKKDYPPEAKRLGIEGAIRVRLTVDAQGKVKSAVLLNRLGHGLDELALSRAKQIEFEPAKDTEDRAVASVVVWTFTMTLPK